MNGLRNELSQTWCPIPSTSLLSLNLNLFCCEMGRNHQSHSTGMIPAAWRQGKLSAHSPAHSRCSSDGFCYPVSATLPFPSAGGLLPAQKHPNILVSFGSEKSRQYWGTRAVTIAWGTRVPCLKCCSCLESHGHRKSTPLQGPRVPGTRRGAPWVTGTPGEWIYLALPVLSCATSLLPGRSHLWSGGSQRGWQGEG